MAAGGNEFDTLDLGGDPGHAGRGVGELGKRGVAILGEAVQISFSGWGLWSV